MLSCPKCGRHYAEGLTVCPEDATPLRADETLMDFVVRDPLVGHVLDEKYRLDERLGEGGMGTVYRATHLLIDRPVAVKVLHTRFVEDESAQARFRREARAAGRLQHPNAVAVTDFGSTPGGYVYIVMELLEGRTLRDVLADESPLAPARAVELMMQIAAAVESAHEAGVIHRDLKPANIFVVQRKNLPPVVKVLDFGIAKLAADSLEDSAARDLTQTGVMIGTPRYMSPEQCDGEHLSPAADVYSLGIIFYEMLTGATPFNGASPLAVALQHSTKPPRPPRELVPALPARLEEVVLHALAKKPEERPNDAGAFREELLATAERLGLANVTAGLPPPGNGAGNGGNGTAGATPAEQRLVINLEPPREGSEANGRARAAARTGDTTVLVDTSEQRRATGALATSTTAAEPSPSHAPAVTRYNVTLPAHRGALRRPTVLIAFVIALVALVAVAASVIRSRRVETAGGASAAATPSPSPVASPQPSPSPAGTAGENAAAKNRRAAKPATQKKPAKGNRVVRTLKKIFKNPF
ncbi:MAG TPA: serine/threonine-protein kinase [Pyrinomonadaceae bacterium]|nr:serine/threonine-protein kinase [Pyrinomonadaceae bacterium]